MNSNDGGAIYRTRDGKNWQLVFQTKPTDAFGVVGVEDMIVYQGDLYAATAYTEGTDLYGTQIWRSSTGNPGSWVQIGDNASLQGTWPDRGSLGVFKGDLYLTDADSPTPAVYRMDGR